MTKFVKVTQAVVIVGVVFIFSMKETEAIPRSAPICCTPDQWEGHIFIDLAQIAFFMHYNISADVSYDFVNSRTFINASFVQRSLYVKPAVQTGTVMYIEDYINECEYELDNQTDCQKAWMPDFNMTKTCIAADAKVLSTGVVGKGIQTVTYNTTLQESFPSVRATVVKDSCLPVHMVYIDQEDMGAVTKVDVFDITPGIKDANIFNVPPQCKHPKMVKQRKADTNGAHEVVKRTIKSHIRKLIINRYFHTAK